jgi:hypothetical protein
MDGFEEKLHQAWYRGIDGIKWCLEWRESNEEEFGQLNQLTGKIELRLEDKALFHIDYESNIALSCSGTSITSRKYIKSGGNFFLFFA